MADLILTVRPAADAAADVEALGRRGVPAMAAPVMTATCLDEVALPAAGSAGNVAAGSIGGLIFTSRHAISGFLALCGGVVPPGWADLPVFAVGRASGRVARGAGFSDVTIGSGGGSGLVPLILARFPACREMNAPLLWPCAVNRGFDMKAALAPRIDVTLLPVYEMMPVTAFDDRALAAIDQGRVGAVILMSARSASLFRDLLARHDLDARATDMALIAGSAAIAAAAGAGWKEEFVARRSTRARLLAIAALFYHRRMTGR